jgi:hypothetical protein
LEPKDWEKLDPYLEGMCESTGGTHDIPGIRPPTVDCRTVYEVTYQKVLAIAKTHCPELVREIEKARHYAPGHIHICKGSCFAVLFFLDRSPCVAI